MMPKVVKASTALMPWRIAWATSFSPRAFSSASRTTSASAALGNDQHAFLVAEQQRARLDPHAADLDRRADSRQPCRAGLGPAHSSRCRSMGNRAPGCRRCRERSHRAVRRGHRASRRGSTSVRPIGRSVARHLWRRRSRRACRPSSASNIRPKGFFNQRVVAARRVRRGEDVGLQHGHGAADQPRRLIDWLERRAAGTGE